MAKIERRMDVLLILMSREADFIGWEAKGNRDSFGTFHDIRR